MASVSPRCPRTITAGIHSHQNPNREVVRVVGEAVVPSSCLPLRGSITPITGEEFKKSLVAVFRDK